MTEENKPQNISELLNINKFKHLSKLQDIFKYFDLDKLDDDSTPLITAKRDTIIVMDNLSFNSTYLIDLVNVTLKNIKTNCVDLIYIDDRCIRAKILNVQNPKSFNYSNSKDVKNIDDFEKVYLHPSIITINVGNNEISMFKENFVFTQKGINKIIDVSKIFKNNGNS